MKIKPGDRFLVTGILGKKYTITIVKVYKFRRVVECLPDEIMLPRFYLTSKRLETMRKIYN